MVRVAAKREARTRYILLALSAMYAWVSWRSGCRAAFEMRNSGTGTRESVESIADESYIGLTRDREGMSFEDKEKLGVVNAALLVVRKLVESNPETDEDAASGVKAQARYSQLLASRLNLTAVQSHRIALAAWLSEMKGKETIARKIASEHALDEILMPDESTAEETQIAAHILGLVKCYQLLKKDHPDLVGDVEKSKVLLKKLLPDDKLQRRLIRHFAKILEDENFLSGSGSGRILLVDPEECVNPTLSLPLTSDGFDIRVAESAQAAFEVLDTFSPHLIMAELSLPLVDGIEFCRQLKRNADWKAIPFVMLTSSKGAKTAAKCLKAGAEDVLTRPVDLEMLFLKIGRLIKLDERSAEGGGVSGSLSDMGFPDMIQVVTAGARSLEIELTHDGQKGTVSVLNGEVVHAEIGDLEGEQAFYQMMQWQNGTFSTRQRDGFEKQTIWSSVMGLLMEGARRSDEVGQGQ